jgi:hypothetical protein
MARALNTIASRNVAAISVLETFVRIEMVGAGGGPEIVLEGVEGESKGCGKTKRLNKTAVDHFYRSSGRRAFYKRRP